MTARGHEHNPAVAAWDALACVPDEFTTSVGIALSEQALAKVELQAGMRFLDVAAGTGSMSLPAARRGAEVLATDISPAMMESLSARARAEGLDRLETRVMDALDLDLDDDSFDVAVSQHGVSILADAPRALAELTRVTKRGGRVLVVSFGPLDQAEFVGMYAAAISACVPDFTGLPVDPPPPPFQLADPVVLRQHLVDAGLRNPSVEPAIWEMEFRSGAHMWNCVRHSNPLAAALVANLDEDTCGEIRQVLDRMLRERTGGALPAVVRTAVNIAIGTG